MNMTYVTPDYTMSMVAKLVGYKGRKFRVSTSIPSVLNSYWDGGSRDYWHFYHLDKGVVADVESNHPVFEAANPRNLERLPERVLLVKHTIFCGKDLGLTFYVNEEDMAKMITDKPVDLSELEKRVLKLTRYRGDYRAQEMRRYGVSVATYDETKGRLVGKGLLTKGGAVTNAGRNVLMNIRW